jgi:mono/diheme cytochrome c family protein
MKKLSWLALVVSLAPACADNDPDKGEREGALGNDERDAGQDPAPQASVTYWQDMVPLFEQHCLQCHQQGGIGPVRLDQYSEAKRFAALIAYDTKARVMPPWHATSDGSCGDFQDSLALSDAEIERIQQWVAAGAPEGRAGDVTLPGLDTLSAAEEYALPRYVPVAQGGEYAVDDDYHCFVVDASVAQNRFITGYDIVPGAPEVVHHVLVSVVDPNAPADGPPSAHTTNAEVMAKLDAESPDRPGWTCFGQAGDGVSVRATPVVWAPGQGVVRFPNDSGAPLRPSDKLVIQVHYNLSDPAQRGRADATRVRLSLAPKVENIAIFATPDALLESLFGPAPDMLEPGKPSVLYTFQKTIAELELEDAEGLIDARQLENLQLWGVMPHMHEAGRKLQLRVKTQAESASRCAVDVQAWDFHWQRMYFYEKAWPVRADTAFEITCDYDTSRATAPILPGWGTGNEMCLTTLFFTVPSR